MTVTGPVGPGDLGVALPHEHVLIDLVREYRGSGLLNDEQLATGEVAARCAGRYWLGAGPSTDGQDG